MKEPKALRVKFRGIVFEITVKKQDLGRQFDSLANTFKN